MTTLSDQTNRSQPSLLEVRDLRVRFSRRPRDVHAVNGVNFKVEVGKTLAVIGESGSGKTVTARAIMGLLANNAVVSGSVRFAGTEFVGLSQKAFREHRGRDVAMVFQDPARSFNPTVRVGHQLTEAIRLHLPLDKDAARLRAIELLQMVRIPAATNRFDEYPHQLSGGMRQRVMIAMAIACSPKLLIADEATTALDVTTQAQIMNLLLDLQRELDMGLVMISHDLGLAASFTDEIVVMYGGKVVEQASTNELFAGVRMPYTRALLDAIPNLERPSHTLLPVVDGRPPDMTRPIVGCSFAPRCPYVGAQCRHEMPELIEHQAGHRYACFFPLEVVPASA